MDMKQVDPNEVGVKLGIYAENIHYFDSVPERTSGGTPYLVQPGVSLAVRPSFQMAAFEPFLRGFDRELKFIDWLEDGWHGEDGTQLVKAFGQLCYMSFGPNRTKNIEMQKYINNILQSGHGSVTEHAQFSFLLWGIGRDFTHELVRHRTGVAFSQVSQRYVDGKVLRFVERPEYTGHAVLHEKFLGRIDRAAVEYDEIAKILAGLQADGAVELTAEKKTDLRKKVNQCARSLLPNETEAPIGFSGNFRALRHVVEMRASGAADVPIRAVTTRIFLIMRSIEPKLFNDYKLYELPDGTYAVATDWRKV